MKKLKLLEQKNDCVLVLNTETKVYKVIDIESDLICMTRDYNNALNCFNSYDIEEVRKEKKKIFTKWLKESTEA
jgi:hypothetical protein